MWLAAAKARGASGRTWMIHLNQSKEQTVGNIICATKLHIDSTMVV